MNLNQNSTPPAPAQPYILPNHINPALVGNAWMQCGMMHQALRNAADDLRRLRGNSRATREMKLDELQRQLDLVVDEVDELRKAEDAASRARQEASRG
ncbi:MAG: hypothetical protein ACH37Z_14965 [Anaerolineae bacterium]